MILQYRRNCRLFLLTSHSNFICFSTKHQESDERANIFTRTELLRSSGSSPWKCGLGLLSPSVLGAAEVSWRKLLASPHDFPPDATHYNRESRSPGWRHFYPISKERWSITLASRSTAGRGFQAQPRGTEEGKRTICWDPVWPGTKYHCYLITSLNSHMEVTNGS